MALNNIRLDVIELRNEGLEKDKILLSLVNKVKEDEASFKAQAEAQKIEIEDLRRQLAMALNNIRLDVIELRNEGLEKDKILLSLVNKVKEDEASFKAQAEAQKIEIEDLRRQLAEAKEKCALAEANREISEYWKTRLEKNVEELRESKERCFEKSLDCVKKLKTSFAKVGALITFVQRRLN